MSGATVDKAEGFMYAREGRVFFFENLENVLRFDRDTKGHLRIAPPAQIPMPLPTAVPEAKRSGAPTGPMMMTPGG